MKEWTIRQRILASFAFLLVLIVAMGVFAFARLETIEGELASVNQDSMLGVRDGSQLVSAWFDNFALTQKYLLQKDRSELGKVEGELKANQANLDSLISKYETHISDQTDRNLLQNIKNERASYMRTQADVLKLGAALKSNEASAQLTNELTPEFQKARLPVQSLVDTNWSDLDRAHKQITDAVVSARIGIGAVLVAVVVLAFGCGFWLIRAVQKSGQQVTTSVTEVAATAKQQQATAGEVAATTSEIGATSKEIWATSKELVHTMNEVSAVAEQSATLAGSGQAGLAQMEDTMRRVMEAAGAINTKLAVLNEKASNISQVVTTITKVADQTNLLSLNAAIEAEKAGEHGRGFSVVAVEIRRLADQTAVATYDIEQMVKEIQSAVAAGVMGMDKFSEEVRRGMQEVQHVGGQLLEIIQQVQTLAPRFESVNEGMQAQASGAEQITEALMQLSEAAQQTVDSLRQSSIAIEDLNLVAHVLLGGASVYK